MEQMQFSWLVQIFLNLWLVNLDFLTKTYKEPHKMIYQPVKDIGLQVMCSTSLISSFYWCRSLGYAQGGAVFLSQTFWFKTVCSYCL